MSRHLLTAVLILVGLIHLLPLSGVLGSEQLLTLYGVHFSDDNALILMRHRAVLFGMLGAFCIAAAFIRSLQLAALALGLASVVSFLALALQAGAYNASIARVVLADWVALALLLAGCAAYAWSARRP